MTDRISVLKTADGAGITYRLVSGGFKRVIVFLHGLASNMTRWSEFTELTWLKTTWDILLVDLRGHGRSQYRGSINMDIWCGDIAAILDKEGYSGAVLAGHCLGANIAINFAVLYPGRSLGLILLEPLFQKSFTGVLKRIESHKIMLVPLISVIRFINRLGLHRRSMPLLDLRELDRNARALMESTGTPEILLKRYSSPMHDLRYISAAAYLQSLRELMRPLPQLARIDTPKLFIFSAGRIFNDPDGTDNITGSLHNCETVILDSYHWIPTEKPVELRETIERWCRNLFD